MERKLYVPMLCWASLLLFLAFSMAAVESTTFQFSIPWILILFRIGFLTVGVILLLRLISFRSQRPWERLVAAYASAAGKPAPTPRSLPFNGTINLILDTGIIISNLAAIGLGWDPNRFYSEWKNAILLDGVSWCLIWIWAAKTCWLRSHRKREILKMSLDDLRSKQKSASPPDPSFARIGFGTRFGFLAVSIIGVAGFAGITLLRVQALEGLAARTGVARCMESIWIGAKTDFEKEGIFKRGSEATTGCLPKNRGSFEVSLGHDENGIVLSVWEARDGDAFHDGSNGNQGLRISPEGKLWEISRIRKF